MTASGTVDIRGGDDVIVVALHGDIDIGCTTSVTAAILEAVPNDARGLAIDLDAVTYLDSAGIRMLFEIVRNLETCRQRTGVVVADDAPLRRLLKITNIHEVADLCDSVEECEQALRG